jgi:hypothetical protein
MTGPTAGTIAATSTPTAALSDVPRRAIDLSVYMVFVYLLKLWLFIFVPSTRDTRAFYH